MAIEKQANHYPAWVGQQEWNPLQKNIIIYVWQFKYANTMSPILYTSNGLICGYITDTHFSL